MLIECGALDSLDFTRPTLVPRLGLYLLQRKIFDEENQDLFAFESHTLATAVSTKFQYPISKIWKIEYETLGFMVTRRLLEFFNAIINKKDVIKASEMINYNHKNIKMVGWLWYQKELK